MAIRRSLWLAILVCLWPAAGFAQDVSVAWRITDAQGGTVNGALVSLTASTAPTPRTTRTGADATFSFDAVPPGAINVQVEAPGFDRWTQMVTVSATTAPLSVVLRIAGVAETVAVVAPKLEEELPQLVQRAGARVQTITSVQIQNGGYNDVSQALQAQVPGLFLSPTAGAFGYVTASLQGSRSNEILWLDLHPAMVPFGATLAVNWVGETFDTVSGFGNVPSGKYAVVNLGTRVFLDARRQHRLNLRFENLLDETYTTAHGRGFTDVGGTPYLFHNLGTPRTFHVSYSFSY